jgi:hypothetical protein
MSQVIVFTNEDGGVSVCYPTGELPIEEVQAKDTPTGSIIVDSNFLPKEHDDFFNAWELVDGKIEVSLVKAKDITKDRLRSERAPLLQALDVQFQRALETAGNTIDIVAEKQRLRDITQLADQATTLEELKAIQL